MYLKFLSLNGQDMGELVPSGPQLPEPDGSSAPHYWRARLLGALIQAVDPDLIGVVEAPAAADRTAAFSEAFLDDAYQVYQGERRGALGLAVLVRRGLGLRVDARSKEESLRDFHLSHFDADGDGIKEVYNWYNRVPFEVTLSGAEMSAPTTLIVVHAKSKGAFIPGDLFAYERISRANRMKLRAQAAAIRKRLDALIGADSRGRVVVMGDMNDGPEFDVHAAMIGGCFLETVMGSIWDPARILVNTHADYPAKERWTIDFMDRILNPMEKSKYGNPVELRSWIDHILVSPELRGCVAPGSAGIVQSPPDLPYLPPEFCDLRPTDHRPPYVTLAL